MLIVNSASELLTNTEQTRAGFVALALERNIQATPHVEQARALHAIAQKCTKAVELLEITSIQKALLSAAGISDKSASHWTEDAKSEAIKDFIATFLEPAGEKFRDELVYRFLLTRGDSLGGSMRNIGGELGERKFTRALIATLKVKDIKIRGLYRRTETWVDLDASVPSVENYLRGLSWGDDNMPRTLIYNLKVPVSKVNVDLCLFRCRNTSWSGNLNQPQQYLALGELKGGIDPAGAFEHWATSRTAISTSRASFALQESHPKTFYIGAAITQRVAGQIWTYLENGTLSAAANLTNDNQLLLLCDWLTSL